MGGDESKITTTVVPLDEQKKPYTRRVKNGVYKLLGYAKDLYSGGVEKIAEYVRRTKDGVKFGAGKIRNKIVPKIEPDAGYYPHLHSWMIGMGADGELSLIKDGEKVVKNVPSAVEDKREFMKCLVGKYTQPDITIASEIYDKKKLEDELTHKRTASDTFLLELFFGYKNLDPTGDPSYIGLDEKGEPKYRFGKSTDVFSIYRNLIHRDNFKKSRGALIAALADIYIRHPKRYGEDFDPLFAELALDLYDYEHWARDPITGFGLLNSVIHNGYKIGAMIKNFSLDPEKAMFKKYAREKRTEAQIYAQLLLAGKEVPSERVPIEEAKKPTVETAEVPEVKKAKPSPIIEGLFKGAKDFLNWIKGIPSKQLIGKEGKNGILTKCCCASD
jgi:hypothetical protein